MRLAGLVLVVLSGGAIALGLWTIGGPEQARRDQRDAQRVTDIRALSVHYRCLGRNALDIDAESPLCPVPEDSFDPLTGDPYTITQPDDGIVQICAEFENRPPPSVGNGFDPATGCLTIALSDTAGTSP